MEECYKKDSSICKISASIVTRDKQKVSFVLGDYDIGNPNLNRMVEIIVEGDLNTLRMKLDKGIINQYTDEVRNQKCKKVSQAELVGQCGIMQSCDGDNSYYWPLTAGYSQEFPGNSKERPVLSKK